MFHANSWFAYCGINSNEKAQLRLSVSIENGYYESIDLVI